MGNEMGSFFSRSTLTSTRKFIFFLAELPLLKVLWLFSQTGTIKPSADLRNEPPTLFSLLRCTVQSVLGASLGCVPAPGDRHLHEA